MTVFDICILGSGAVGRALALALSSQGWRVALVGKPLLKASSPDIRTYALNRRSVQLLSQLRVWEQIRQADAARITEMRITGDTTGHLRFSAWEQCTTELAWIVDAQALEDRLADAIRYAPHITLMSEPPAPQSYALQAICEGATSATRDQLGIEVERFDYGHRAIAARLIADRPHQGIARQWFRSPDILALLPFNNPAPEASYGLVWSQPSAEADKLLNLADHEFEQALTAATQAAAGQLRLGSERATWPMRLMRVQPWCGPGWVLLGDAAHQVHPLAGQGLNLGLADVATLTQVLGEVKQHQTWRSPGDERILRRYERARMLPTAAMAQVTDGLLHFFAYSSPVVRGLRNTGLSLLQHMPPLKSRLIKQAMDM